MIAAGLTLTFGLAYLLWGEVYRAVSRPTTKGHPR